MPPVDKSIFNSKNNQGESYLDELVFAICVNGESLNKYQKIVQKKLGAEVYANVEQFVKTFQQQVERKQFTNTSLLNLKYLGKNAGLSEEAVNLIVDNAKKQTDKERLDKEREIEESRIYTQCKTKADYQSYVRKYPNSKYVEEAQNKIKTFLSEENKKEEESSFWKKCDQNDKSSLQDYLRKYPNGIYAIQARSKITELETKERIEKNAIEESRMFNQCRTMSDYKEYLRKYPKGLFADKAKKLIEEVGQKELEEKKFFDFCKDKSDYQNYLRKYPNGKYVKEAQAKIKTFENADRQAGDDTAFWNQCTPRTKQNLQKYLNRYPNGRYAIQAKSKIAEIERIEREAIEDSRMFNQCRTLADYKDYVHKHPTGQYIKKAKEKIKELEPVSREKREIHILELETYKQCKTKEDFQRYLKLYPDGMYRYAAHSKIAHLEKMEVIKAEQQERKKASEQKEAEKNAGNSRVGCLYLIAAAIFVIGFIGTDINLLGIAAIIAVCTYIYSKKRKNGNSNKN